MPINFPDAPSSGDTHTVGDKTWTYDGTAWTLVTGATADHGNLDGLGDDDHTQYALADGTRGTFEASGAVSTHEAASDPHTQYLLADGTRTATELTVSGDLTVDTDTLHVDSTNNRVGIGTTSPTASLTVTSATDDAKVKIDSNGGSVGVIDATANTNDATGRWLSINPSGGNVGIGTASPSTKADIYTDSAAGVPYPLTLSAKNSSGTKKDYVRIGYGIEQGAAGIESGGLRIQTLQSGSVANALTFTGHASAQEWNFYTQGSSRLRIDSSGNVYHPTSSWFHARLSATVSTWDSNNQTLRLPYNSTVRNIGNDYDTTNHYYVAPVDGRYAFTASLYTTSGAVLEQWWYVINGGRAEAPRCGGQFSIQAGTGAIYLAAGDQVGVHFWAGGIGNINLQASSLHTFFMGGLVH